MSELKYKPVRHDHDAFLKKALETEYALVTERLSAKTMAATRKTVIN